MCGCQWNMAQRNSTDYAVDNIIHSITCLICMDMMDKAVVIKDCSHRFCNACLDRWLLKVYKKCCPLCKHPVPSRRHYVRDQFFDELIQSISIVLDDFIAKKKTSNERLKSVVLKYYNEEFLPLHIEVDKEISSKHMLWFYILIEIENSKFKSTHT